MEERREENARVLITGGTGFIGSYLAMDLPKKGKRVVLADRSYDLRRIEGFEDKYEEVKDRLTFIQGDLSLSEHVHQWWMEGGLHRRPEKGSGGVRQGGQRLSRSPPATRTLRIRKGDSEQEQ